MTPEHRARLKQIHSSPKTAELHRKAVLNGAVPGWFRGTEAALTALKYLPTGWVSEFPVSVSGSRRVAILDLAHPETKRAIEVDGPGHHGPTLRNHDAARDAELASLGWEIRRISNQAALAGELPEEWKAVVIQREGTKS